MCWRWGGLEVLCAYKFKSIVDHRAVSEAGKSWMLITEKIDFPLDWVLMDFAYLSPDSRQNDYEWHKNRTESKNDHHDMIVHNCRRPVHGGVQRWSCVLSERVEQSLAGRHGSEAENIYKKQQQ